MGKYVRKKNRSVSARTIVVCALIVVFTVLLATGCQRANYEEQIAEIKASHEDEINALRAELRDDYEFQMTALKKYYEYGADASQVEQEAEYISKVIYGTARNHAASDKKAVVWCILNRVEHYGHPDTVKEVCEQPKQWMGYSSDNPVLDDIYELVLAELKIWHNDGHRPMSNEYIYLSWSSKEILLRDSFEENKNTNYWRMK